MHALSDDDRSDEQLVLDYAAGDAGAFSVLFERHERAVYRFLLRSLRGDSAIADDLLQETWVSVIRNAARWEPRARFATWLFGIARTRLVDHWRARRHEAREESSFARASADRDASDDDCSEVHAAWIEQLPAARSDEPEVRAMARAEARALVSAVEALPQAQREAFLLHAEGGLALDEIASLTGVGIETAKSRLRYALAKLRDAMGEWR